MEQQESKKPKLKYKLRSLLGRFTHDEAKAKVKELCNDMGIGNQMFWNYAKAKVGDRCSMSTDKLLIAARILNVEVQEVLNQEENQTAVAA